MYEHLGISVSKLGEHSALVVIMTETVSVKVYPKKPIYGYRSPHLNKTLTIWKLNQDEEKTHPYYVTIKEYRNKSGQPPPTIFVAVFPLLPPGNYGVAKPDSPCVIKKITLFPGMCEEVRID